MSGKIFVRRPLIRNLLTDTGHEVGRLSGLLLISLLSSVIPGYTTVKAQHIWVSCRAQDHRSHRFVAANWQWADSTDRPVYEQKADADGFMGLVPQQARYLTVSSSGYRPIRLPVQWPPIGTDSLSFRFVVPVVPIDKPTANQLYFQSEQRPLQLANPPVRTSPVVVKFVIGDALTDQPVRANLCLFQTRARRQRCYDVSTLTTKLLPPDIVAIEVRAVGYQLYLGNLIIADTTAESTLDYKIRLNPTPTLLAVTVPEPYPDLTLEGVADRASQILTTTDNTHFFVSSRPGRYRLTSQGKPLPESRLSLREGINAYYPAPLVLVSSSPRPGRETTIYFLQSSYELSDSARRQLDRVVAVLKQNPQLKGQITGHTDNVGNPLLNHTLSEFRAKITRTYLLSQGIQESRLSLTAVGAGQPAVANDTEANRQRNRRVSVVVYE